MQVSVAPSGTPLTGKVINSLTIRGLDQVSLRVTISEIRRDIVKQLGVNMTRDRRLSGVSSFNRPAIRSRSTARRRRDTRRRSAGPSAGMNLTATLQAFERQGVARTLAEPTVTAVSGEIGQVPRRRHDSDPQRRNLQQRRLHAVDHPAALWRDA